MAESSPVEGGGTSKASVEACLARKTETRTATCPSRVSRECLRASVPFRTPYTRIKRCFECCVRHWLEVSGLAANIRHHVERLKVRGHGKSRASPDLADFGLFDPVANVLVHTHAFAAISHVRMHPYHGCTVTPTAQNASFVVASLYQYDPNLVVVGKFRDAIAQPASEHAACVQAMRSHYSRLVVDLWRQFKFVPETKVFERSSLLLANNVGNVTSPHCSSKGFVCLPEGHRAYDKIFERTIGVRAASVWHGVLEHPRLEAVERQRRLVLCCCMNTDPKHGSRRDKLVYMQRFPEFLCAGSDNKYDSRNSRWAAQHLGPPRLDFDDESARAIETDVQAKVQHEYVLQKGTVDAHMPLLLLNSKFVFSPNGVAEQCFREYEAMISGAYPLVDHSWWEPRRAMLASLPVVPVLNWSTVTPAFLDATWAKMEARSYDVKHLFLPFYYDKILASVGM